MKDRLRRIITMLQMIPEEPGKITTSELWGRLRDKGFETDKRSVQRDLRELSEEFPFYADERGKPFGWTWRKGARVRGFPALDNSSALAYLLAGRMLEDIMPTGVLDMLKPEMKQAKEALKGIRSTPKWEDKVRVVPRGLRLQPAEVKPAVVRVVYGALLTGTRFKAKYQTKEDKENQTKTKTKAGGYSEYEVNPLGLVHRHSVGYLVCTLYDYQDIMQLALHRFQSAELLGERVKVPAGFNLDDYIGADEFSYPTESRLETIELAFNKSEGYHLSETPLSKNQKIKKKGERVHVTADVRPSQELIWWILGFGDTVEVIKPPSLRAAIGDIIKDAAEFYQ